jgi:hypothetical protein
MASSAVYNTVDLKSINITSYFQELEEGIEK